MIQIQALLVFMIIGAIIAVELKDLLGSVIAVGAVGMGLAITFIFLGAPELATIQLVVEILVIIIFLRAVGIKEKASVSSTGLFQMTFAMVIIGLILVFVYKSLVELPGFGYAPLSKVSLKYITDALKETGSPNIVTAITTDYRAMDTFCQAMVLFTTAVGVISIMRRKGRK